jgi:cyanophycinase-like exopeptidase
VSGSIALVGSGEYLPEMADLERSLIEDGIQQGKDPLFVQIPTAAGQESLERLKYWKRLGKSQADALGVEQVFLPIFERDHAQEAKYVDLISRGALIYMSGGDPHHLATSLMGTPVGMAIAESWQSGSSLAGCSAGAMVMSSYIPQFRLSRHEPTPGFNWLPGIRVIPHFDKFFRWIPESAAKRLLQTPEDEVLLGIDELTALVKRFDQKDWLVRGKSQVHLLSGLTSKRLIQGESLNLSV